VLNVVAPHPTAVESTSRHLSIDTSRADRPGTLEDLRSGTATGRESRPGRRGTEPALQPSAAFRPLPWPHTACPPFRQTFGSPIGLVLDVLMGRDSSSLRGLSDTLWRCDEVLLGRNPRHRRCALVCLDKGLQLCAQASGTLSKRARQLVACACVLLGSPRRSSLNRLKPHHVWAMCRSSLLAT